MWSVPSRLSVYANAVLTAAGRASNPTHFPPGSRCAPNLTLNVVVISSNGEGDRSVESLEVKVPEGWTFQSDPYRGASNLAGRSGSEPVKPRNRPPARNGLRECRECRAGGHSAKANVGIEVSGYRCRTPRGRRGRHVRKECAVKARNRSRVASALPHSEGIAYKPPCGEIAVCLRVGRMRPIK